MHITWTSILCLPPSAWYYYLILVINKSQILAFFLDDIYFSRSSPFFIFTRLLVNGVLIWLRIYLNKIWLACCRLEPSYHLQDEKWIKGWWNPQAPDHSNHLHHRCNLRRCIAQQPVVFPWRDRFNDFSRSGIIGFMKQHHHIIDNYILWLIH